MKHVGRTEDPKNDGFGLVIFHAKNDEEAHKYMQEDPAVSGGQMMAICLPYRTVFNQSSCKNNTAVFF